MTQYYLPPPPAEGMSPSDSIVRDDGAWIPNDPANSDWAAYQEWLTVEGNAAQPWPATGVSVPQPAPPPADTTAPPPATDTTPASPPASGSTP
jgi:hypothetical protein